MSFFPRIPFAAMAVLLATALAASAQAPGPGADEAATAMLRSAQKAFNERQFPVAIDRFREFLRAYPDRSEGAAAQYGLGVALLEAPQKNIPAAIQALQQAANRSEFAHRPFALYYLGVAQRSAGERAAEEAANKPPDQAQPQRQFAAQAYGEAARFFATAAEAFLSRAGTPPPVAERPEDLDWVARSRCDHCDMLLRTERFKEAEAAASVFLNEPVLDAGPHRELALYQQGCAKFALKDYTAAGRALSRLAPFGQEFGPHARYLLARVHHLAGEQTEAAEQYQAVLMAYQERKATAEQVLRNPGALSPAARAGFEAFARRPPPDYVPSATFHLALLGCERERFPDAIEKFNAFVQANPNSGLIPEAQLRLGFCHLQTRNYAEATRVLQPLAAQPALADRALWWLARCQIGGADRANPQTFAQALTAAAENLGRAAEQAGRAAQTDPDARVRRADILLDLGDALQQLARHREAADSYRKVVQEAASPGRSEQAEQRRVAALHLAGAYAESDQAANQFQQNYPASSLLPSVLFRRAENAYFMALAAETQPNAQPQQRAQESRRLLMEAVSRYLRVVSRHADFAQINHAREGLASCYHRLGRYADAAATLADIEPESRVGDLVATPVLLADCLIRLVPEAATDALAAGEALSLLQRAAQSLDGFATGQPQHPRAPEALARLGWCYQRIAALVAGAEDRKQATVNARGAYERLIQQFPKDPQVPVAVVERAACMAALGEVGPAAAELGRFLQDPWRQAPVAPLAVVRFAQGLRAQNRAGEAVNALQNFRAQNEAALVADPARAEWAARLQYEHALALKEMNKPADAATLFESLARQFPATPAGQNALWRGAQVRREELAAALRDARGKLAQGNLRPEQRAPLEKTVQDAVAALRQLVAALQTRGDAMAAAAGAAEPRQWLLYEVAWCYRTLADAEAESARQAVAQQALEAARRKPGRQPADGSPADALRDPAVPLATLAPRVSEHAARECYERLVAIAPDTALADQARVELAESLIQRSRHDEAEKHLVAVLAHGPKPPLSSLVHGLLGIVCLSRGDAAAALSHAETVLKDPTDPVAATARYVAGEAHARAKNWTKTIEMMLPFRDHGPWQSLPDLSDRALLRLGQALMETNQWDPARQTLGWLVQRFPRSAVLDEALYTTGWAWQRQEQPDRAIETYTQLTRQSVSEWAARAQLQIGLCQAARKRYAEAAAALLAVPLTYDFPEWNAAALSEAGRAYADAGAPEKATETWQRVLREYPASPWAQTARQALADLAKRESAGDEAR